MNTPLVPILRSLAMLIVSIAIIVLGSMTSYGVLTAPQLQKSVTANAKVLPNSIQSATRTLSARNGATTVASPPPTQVVLFSPSGIRGTLDALADCWTTSYMAPRANAWRCRVQNSIYDPCFSTPTQANSVICTADPTGDTRGLKAMLAHPLPTGTYGSGIQAWMMRLSDGSVCSYYLGATSVISGERINYGCTNGLRIVGFPRIGSVWMVKEVKNGQSQLAVAPVGEVWW